jgi:hypothetical protein
MIVLNESCEDEICEEEGCEEEEDALGELMKLIKYLSAKLERLESEESTEDFPVLEVDVLGSSIEDDNEDFIVVEALHSAPEVPVVPSFDDYSDEDQQGPTSQFADLGLASLYMTAMNQILSWICQISKSIQQSPVLYSLTKIIMRKSAILSSRLKRRYFPWVLFMMIMTLTLGKSIKKKRRSRRGSS